MYKSSALLRGVGIGAGITASVLFSALISMDYIFLLPLIPVILAALCSFADKNFSFLGYSIGFGIAALLFSLVMGGISSDLVLFLGVFAIIYGFTLLPVIFLGVFFHKKKGEASTEQGARVPPIDVPEGVEVRVKTSYGTKTEKSLSRLEELDKQSTLTYLCPYCNAQVQATDVKCPTCGADLDHRVTKIN